MNDLERKVEKVFAWKKKERVQQSFASVSLSGGNVVFLCVDTQKAGKFCDVIDLEKSDEYKLESEMEARLQHIEEIGKKFIPKHTKGDFADA